MAELDSLIDSLLPQRGAQDVSYINDKHAATIQLRDTGGQGQGLFAERFISDRHPICSLGYPTMMAIDSDSIRTTCYHCLVITANPLPLPTRGVTNIALKICNGCQLARFCSRECQVSSWQSYHKYECKIMKKMQANLQPAVSRAVMRAVLLKDRNRMSNEEWDRIVGLTSHAHIIAARGRTPLTDMAEGIKHLTQSGMDVGTIQRLIFVMKFNAIQLPTPIHGAIGVMLDPLVSKINHSCAPNVSVHRAQNTMVSGWLNDANLSEERQTFAHVIPLRKIEKGEELLTCYVAPTQAVDTRKKKCMEDYLFECNCSLCQSDHKAATNLTGEQPSLCARYSQWISSVIRHLSRLGRDNSALERAAAAMSKSEQFLDHPTLYTTGDFADIAMGIIKEGLKAQALDEALINVLRLHFLVYPERFVGRQNPTILHTSFLMLDILDTLLGISTSAVAITDAKVEGSLQKLEARGIGRDSLRYWRHRICAGLRKTVEESPLDDLFVLVEEREEDMQASTAKLSDTERDDLKSVAEQSMRNLLGLKEGRWNVILQKTAW